jgi:hypothetical protein
LEEFIMRMKSLYLMGLIVAAAATLQSQPVNGPVYWSAVAPDCSSLAGESPVAIANSSGKTIGYACYVSGTFVWLAAGGGWSTSIRVAAPASAAIGVDYTFYDASGNNLELDTTIGGGSSTTSGNGVNFALSANQPAEIGLVGATSDAPKYASTATGSVYAVFYCPDAATCGNVVPQLLYSALPATPWALSVPISWDTELWTQWSAEGIDDGGTHRVSLVIYNEDMTATSYTVRVYDSTGSLAGTGTTPPIPPLKPLSIGSFGEGGTYGALLSDVITTRLPPGVFKILVDGGSKYSAVEVLQFNGQSATALQVAYDSAPGSSSRAASVERMNFRSARVASALKRAFSALQK